MDSNGPVGAAADRQLGNIYDRLDAARRRRERLLRTPEAANDDRQVTKPRAPSEVFPRLKPPRVQGPGHGPAPRRDAALPWLLGALIFVLIFVFAVR